MPKRYDGGGKVDKDDTASENADAMRKSIDYGEKSFGPLPKTSRGGGSNIVSTAQVRGEPTVSPLIYVTPRPSSKKEGANDAPSYAKGGQVGGIRGFGLDNRSKPAFAAGGPQMNRKSNSKKGD